MKPLKIGLSVIIVAVLFALVTNKRAAATPQNQMKHECVILHASEFGYPTNNGPGTYVYQYDGMRVYCSSSSAGAPKFDQMGLLSVQGSNGARVIGNLVQLAEAIAQLQDEGFTLAHAPGQGYGGDYVFTKP